MLPEIGTVAVATIWQRLLARLIDSLVYGVFYATFVVIGVALASSSTTVTDYNGHTTSEQSGMGTLGFLLALAAAMGSGLVYEWLMLAHWGATLGKMALGIKVVNQVTGQLLGFGSAFVRPLVPLAASVFCTLLALLVYLSPLFDKSGRLRGWHDKAADDVVIKVR
ncbi:RDD family protein [Mycobacterium sp.]|uniref:RDD family protein n=1 Tax=Mycobacterium sp. TaxID=1785 RepID=UPI003F991181